MNGYGYSFEPMMRTPCSYCNVPQHKMPQAYAMPEQYMIPPKQHMMPEYTMPESLEEMYPKSYIIIYPQVKRHCHMMERMHGGMHNITREHVEEACENIYKSCEKDLKEYMKDEDDHDNESESESEHSHDHRQYGYVRRGLAGDLIQILLLRELFGRRRRPYYNYYGGYAPNGYDDYDYDYSD